ncbi:MAG: hypothetical protein KatS3mg053_3890 [Candidatus Roseilinea sp.]|nr:MAG: hypothetical protein KatS3mg053_3890 [Candidatus Roseilinea sp.]
MTNLKLIAGVALLLVIVLASVAGPTISRLYFPNDTPLRISEYPAMQKPSAQHPMGTDMFGRDALAVFLHAMGLSLAIGLVAGLTGTVVGVTIGCVSAYVGGPTDTLTRVLTDMFLVLPTLPILLVLSLYISRWNVITMGLLLGSLSWPFVARTLRAQVLSLRERPFMDLARLNCESVAEIVFEELMPSLMPYIFLSMSSAVVVAILSEVGLQFIGIGAAGLPTIGYMLTMGFGSGALSIGLGAQLIWPSLFLIGIFLSLNLINLGLEERFNPRLQRLAREN